jgi:hypothetical protein
MFIDRFVYIKPENSHDNLEIAFRAMPIFQKRNAKPRRMFALVLIKNVVADDSQNMDSQHFQLIDYGFPDNSDFIKYLITQTEKKFKFDVILKNPKDCDWLDFCLEQYDFSKGK